MATPKKHTPGIIVGGKGKELSLVKKAANARVFSLMKSMEDENPMDPKIQQLLKEHGLQGQDGNQTDADTALILELIKSAGAGNKGPKRANVLEKMKGMWAGMSSILSQSGMINEADFTSLVNGEDESTAGSGSEALEKKVDSLASTVETLAKSVAEFVAGAPAAGQPAAGTNAETPAADAELQKRYDELVKEKAELEKAAPVATAQNTELEKKIQSLEKEVQLMKSTRQGGNHQNPDSQTVQLTKAEEEAIEMEKFWAGTAPQAQAIKLAKKL